MTEDFKIGLIRLLAKAIPELKGKILHGAVDEGTKEPYAVFITPEEVPIRTKHGIVGTSTTFELLVVEKLMVAVEALKRRAIKALEGQTIDGKKVYYVSSESEYYHQTNTHGYSITFKIK